MNSIIKKAFGLILFVILVIPSLSMAKYAPHVNEESTYDYISHEIYCFFTGCEDIKININDNKKEIKNNIIIEEKKEDNLNTKKEITIQKEIIKKTKYINTGNTVVKKYYNTIEKTPVINNTYPKEIINTTEKVVEEYNDSSLKRQIRSNRGMISQLAGMDTSDDNLSDNKLNDLSDVSANPNINGQVLT